ncbi:glycosyltransferase family 2 protein [Gymnodinialimonas hymeniacidonis]|uniref:glycosyltransferase family 2 protein n=1 Tax=Gymnodinialimonas hymeniacidonis TaxID=3126508 RepID=UPI0034C6185A
MSTPTRNTEGKPRLSILCPVYNEENVVPLFWGRIAPVIKDLSAQFEVHLVFLDNCSTDATYDVIQALRADHDNIFLLRLSANVGYQKSLQCGLVTIESDVYAFIDVDCEDPPEMLKDFVEQYNEGYDIVYGIRKSRPESELLLFMRRGFYRVVRALADEDSILLMAEFSLFCREVRDAIINETNSFPFIRSNIARVGFRRKGVEYTRHHRIAGETNYNFSGMMVFAIAGILTTTTLPLRLPIYTFPFWLVLLFACGAAGIVTGSAWWFLCAFMLFSAYVGFCLMFIALYLARSYKNTLGRPNATIHQRLSVLPEARHG